MKARKRKAHLGQICQIGEKPVFAWIERGQIHFHRKGDRHHQDPSPIALTELYKQATGLRPDWQPKLI